MAKTASTIKDPAQSAPQIDSFEAPTLLVDDKAYAFDALSDRAKLLSGDFVRTNQEWTELHHRYRQFLAMETTVVNQLKEELDRSGLQPHDPSSSDDDSPPALLTIDATAYAIDQIPDSVRLYVDDLVRANQERSLLEFRLRQLDAARSAFQSALGQELDSSGVEALTVERAEAA